MEKSSQLVVKMQKGEKQYSVGMVSLNLATFLGKEKQRVKAPIEKCPDAGATLEFSVSNTLINVTSGSETMSSMQGAQVMSIDSGPDSEFKFTDVDDKAK